MVASCGGDDRSPAWFHDLVAEPVVTVEVGRTQRQLRASVTEEADKEPLWPRLVAMYGG